MFSLLDKGFIGIYNKAKSTIIFVGSICVTILYVKVKIYFFFIIRLASFSRLILSESQTRKDERHKNMHYENVKKNSSKESYL